MQMRHFQNTVCQNTDFGSKIQIDENTYKHVSLNFNAEIDFFDGQYLNFRAKDWSKISSYFFKMQFLAQNLDFRHENSNISYI